MNILFFFHFRYLRHLAWKEERQKRTEAGDTAGDSLGQEFVPLPHSRKLMMDASETASYPTVHTVDDSYSDQSETVMEEVSPGVTKKPSTQLDTENVTSDWLETDLLSWDDKPKEESDWPTLTEEDDPWSVCGTKSSEDFWGETSSSSDITPEITQKHRQESKGKGGEKQNVSSDAALATDPGCKSKIATETKQESLQSTDKLYPSIIEEEDEKPLSQPTASSHSHTEVEEPKTSEKKEIIDRRCLDEDNQGICTATVVFS